jgi:hypothetical protein
MQWYSSGDLFRTRLPLWLHIMEFAKEEQLTAPELNENVKASLE